MRTVLSRRITGKFANFFISLSERSSTSNWSYRQWKNLAVYREFDRLSVLHLPPSHQDSRWRGPGYLCEIERMSKGIVYHSANQSASVWQVNDGTKLRHHAFRMHHPSETYLGGLSAFPSSGYKKRESSKSSPHWYGTCLIDDSILLWQTTKNVGVFSISKSQ